MVSCEGLFSSCDVMMNSEHPTLQNVSVMIFFRDLNGCFVILHFQITNFWPCAALGVVCTSGLKCLPPSSNTKMSFLRCWLSKTFLEVFLHLFHCLVCVFPLVVPHHCYYPFFDCKWTGICCFGLIYYLYFLKQANSLNRSFE